MKQIRRYSVYFVAKKVIKLIFLPAQYIIRYGEIVSVNSKFNALLTNILKDCRLGINYLSGKRLRRIVV